MKSLRVLAGKTAYEHIKTNSLSPNDISLILGASGAAKWLVLYGLDTVLFSRWLKHRQTPLHLFGTSIGAWKFVAAAQKNPRTGFEKLKDAYIHQVFDDKITQKKIDDQTRKIMDQILSESIIEQVLSHPFLRVGFSAVRSKGIMASKVRLLQAAAMWSAFELNLLSRRLKSYWFDRVFFHDKRFDPGLLEMETFNTRSVALDSGNFSDALLASASIPLIMPGVKNIEGAPKGVYRDGGLLDYHPIFPPGLSQKGLVLYPHFYPYIKPGWFDKKLPNRNASGSVLDKVILLCPSDEFIHRLPYGRIPDRNDFLRFKGKDRERIKAWKTTADMSLDLGESFIDIVNSERLGTMLERLN